MKKAKAVGAFLALSLFFFLMNGVSVNARAITDADWTGMGAPGFDDCVRAIIVDGPGNVYAGGEFTTAGGAGCGHVAKKVGGSWAKLGPGIDGGDVYALASDNAGNLYAGGSFDTAGGVACARVAKWNGVKWEPLGVGMNGPVYALAVDGSGNLYAGGEFTTAGDATREHIAKWNGSTWAPVGSGMNGAVRALTFDAASNLYAGGEFTTAGGATCNRLAKWNGENWSAWGTGMNGTIHTLVFDKSGALYAGGEFTTAGGVGCKYIAKWNAIEWKSLGTGMSYYVYALRVSGSGDLFAAGGFTSAGGVACNRLAKWNGSTWSALGTGIQEYIVYSLAIDSSDNLYAGGSFYIAGDARCDHIAKWNGSGWAAIGTGMAPYSAGMTLANDGAGNMIVGGDFTDINGIAANNIAKWNGSTWSTMFSGTNNAVMAATCDIAGAGLYVGGEFNIAGNVNCGYFAKWDKTRWSMGDLGMNYYVYALAFDQTAKILYAGGNFDTAGNVDGCYDIARWNGAAWSPLGTGMNGIVYALAFDQTAKILYAGGSFSSAGGVACKNVAKWNGTTWFPLGNGPGAATTDVVYALTVDNDGTVYAGGYFTAAGSCKNVARWDGAAWSALGTGVNSGPTTACVRALTVDKDNNLYVGGAFAKAGETHCDNVARWDGAAWSALGSGTNGEVKALAFDNNHGLYACGDFSLAGGKASSGIAKCAIAGQPATTYTVTFVAKTGGTLSGTVSQKVDEGGATLPVTAVPDTGYEFLKWTKNGADYSPANPVTARDVNENMTLTAIFSTGSYSVTFAASSGGALSGETRQNVKTGDNTSPVTAVPSAGYEFAKWTRNDADYSLDNPLTVTDVIEDMSLTAMFRVSGSYLALFSAGKGGTLSGETAQSIAPGGDASPVTAVPNSDCLFVKWTNDGADYSTSNPLTLSDVNADLSLIAAFAPIVTLNMVSDGHGTTTPAIGSTPIPLGEAIPIDAAPVSGYAFKAWTVSPETNGVIANPNAAKTVIVLSGNAAVTATFAPRTQLTMLSGAHGTVVPNSGTYEVTANTPIAISAEPDTGWRFKNWTAEPTTAAIFENAQASTTTVSLTHSAAVAPAFERLSYTVLFQAGANGSLNGEERQTIFYGENSSPVTAEPDTGYAFSMWTLNSHQYSTDNPLTVKNVVSNLRLVAEFKFVSLVLTMTSSGQGTTTPADGNHNVGTNVPVAIEAFPDTGFQFDGWAIAPLDAGSIADSRAVATTVALTDCATVTAKFVTRSCVVKFKAGAHGTLTGETSQTIAYGSDCSAVTATPDSYYCFSGWKLNGVLYSKENPLTVRAVTDDMTLIAEFAAKPALTLATNGQGMTKPYPDRYFIDPLAPFAIEAFPDTGFQFDGWAIAPSDAGSIADSASASTTVTLTKFATVTATFGVRSLLVTFQADAHGDLSGQTTQSVAYGGDASQVAATPRSGYAFAEWTLDGAPYSTDNPLTVKNVTRNMTLTANFTIKTDRYHSADYHPADWRIDVFEILRVTTLFNNGLYYKVDASGPDGFNPSNVKIEFAPGTHHSADYNPADGQIDIFELSRVTALFNKGLYYKVDASGPDGYAPSDASP